jgi:hypothetical protein
MVANFINTPPQNVHDTISWLIRLGRPPLPECPIEAAKQGKEPKQPCFLDGKYLKTVNWKQWQNTQPIEEIYKAWFQNPKTGIGTLGGWNGKHWLGWIDFDRKDFASGEECDRIIAEWLDQYPLMKDAPMFRTPSGGYRFQVAFNKEPQNFKANSGFSLKRDGSHHVGELLSKNGGHTLLPPTVGVSGQPYQWVQWSEYPPIVDQPEDVGLYPVQKKVEAKTSHPSVSKVNNWTGGSTLTDLLRDEIYPRLTLERAFNWHGHDFRQHGSKLKGNCPWHDSKSGTSFYAEVKDGSPVWRCPACEIGGGVIEYRHRLSSGNGSPRSSEFVALVKELASEVGVTVPDIRQNLGGSGGNGGDGGDGGSSTPNKVVNFPGFECLTIDQVTQKIDELINRGLTGSQLTGELNRLAAASQIYTGELRKLYYERLSESDLKCDRDDNKTQVENLLNLGDQSLDLQDYLPRELAEPLTVWCDWLSIRPEVALTALLTGVSSLHKVGTELVIHRNQSFRVPPTIFSALVSESGQRKSPIFSNIIRHPLNELRQEKIDAYKAAMEDYKAAMEAWEQSENKGQKPEPPKEPVLYYFTNATGESIPVQASKAPEKAMLALIDELSGLFNSANSYRGGRGSDKQDLLSYFDGSGQTILRASGVKVDVRNIYLSVFGTIQPEVLKNHMADCSDPDGQWARFLFVNQPLAAATLSDDDGCFVQIRDRIAGFYRQIDQLPEMEYRLSRPAFKRYQRIYHQLEKLRVTHPRPGMRAVYSKMEGYIGRLALNLHVLWEIASGKACPDEEIQLFIMEMAIALAKFYIGQIKLTHSFSDEEGVAPHIVKLIELSKRLDTNSKDGWVRAQQYRDQFAIKKRPSAQQARDWMSEAVLMGYGRTRGTGNRLEYHWRSDNNDSNTHPPAPDNLGNLGKVREDLGNICTEVVTPIIKGIQDNLGNLGKGIPNSSLAETLVETKMGETLLEGGSVPEVSLTPPQDTSAIETVGDSDLGNNLGNPAPKFPEVSLSVCQFDNASVPVEAIAPTPVPVDEETISDLAELLELCDSKEALHEIRQTSTFTPEILNESCKRLSPETHQQIKQWVIELNREPKVGDLIFVNCWPHTDRLGPYLLERIEGDCAKIEGFERLVPLSELRRA